MHVAGSAPARNVRGCAAAVVGDSVRARVRAVRLAAVARAEQHSHETGRVKVRCVRDEVLRDRVLVMAARVVLGQEVLVAYGNLPCHELPAGLAVHLRHPRQVAREVGVHRVGRIPPVREAGVVSALRLPPAGVMVIDVVEDEIPRASVRVRRGAFRVEEGGRGVGHGDRVQRRAPVAAYVIAARPQRRMDGEQGVGCVEVADVQQRPRESLRGIRNRRHIGEARALDAGGQRRRVAAACPLLEVAPQVRLDVHDHGLAERAGLLHQKFEVGVVGRHRRRVVQVAEVAIRLAGAGGRRRLQQLVVRKHRDVAVRARRVHVVGRVRARRSVPGLPPAPGVDAAREIRVAIFPRHAG